MQDGLSHEELTHIGDNRAVGTHNHAKLTSIKGKRAPRLGQLDEYNESEAIAQSRGIYQSKSAPLLAHVWPTISQTEFSKVVPSIRSDSHLSQDMYHRKKSYDAYGASGTKFRQSTAGNAFTAHTGGINMDAVPAGLQKQLKKDAAEHHAAIVGKEQKKQPWNRSPHYHDRNGPAPKLNANPYATVTYSEFHSTKKKKSSKKTVFSYTRPPYPIICPEPVLWELSRKKDKEIARTKRIQQTARLDATQQAAPLHAPWEADSLGTMQEENEPEDTESPSDGDLPPVRGSIASFPGAEDTE